jgi:hypothetical protein
MSNGYDDQNRPIVIDEPEAAILTQQACSGLYSMSQGFKPLAD